MANENVRVAFRNLLSSAVETYSTGEKIRVLSELQDALSRRHNLEPITEEEIGKHINYEGWGNDLRSPLIEKVAWLINSGQINTRNQLLEITNLIDDCKKA